MGNRLKAADKRQMLEKTRSSGEEKTKPNIKTTEKTTTNSLMQQNRPVDFKNIPPDNRKKLMTHTRPKLLPSFLLKNEIYILAFRLTHMSTTILKRSLSIPRAGPKGLRAES